MTPVAAEYVVAHAKSARVPRDIPELVARVARLEIADVDQPHQALRSSLHPQVCLVVALLVVQAVANLYLPNLTADIINNGIEKGDIHYIWTTGRGCSPSRSWWE